jgi:alpha-beta hydrolase superfamily lysophospholipase
MVKHDTGTMDGVGNTRIFYQSWRPDAPVGTVVVVHGYAEHSGRYAHVAAALSEAGYAVWALDHRGHGRSEGDRAIVTQFEHFVVDLASFVRLVREQSGDLPLFILGHSMGGLISTHYAFDHQHQLSGLILTGPAFKLDEGVSPLLLAVSGLVSALAPNAKVAPFDASGVSRDVRVVEAYMADELNYHGHVKARMGRELMLAGRGVLTRAPEITIPVLVVQGEADRLVSPAGTYAAFAAFASADKTLRKYPEAYHEVLNEPEQAEIIPLIREWLDAHRERVVSSS